MINKTEKKGLAVQCVIWKADGPDWTLNYLGSFPNIGSIFEPLWNQGVPNEVLDYLLDRLFEGSKRVQKYTDKLWIELTV